MPFRVIIWNIEDLQYDATPFGLKEIGFFRKFYHRCQGFSRYMNTSIY